LGNGGRSAPRLGVDGIATKRLQYWQQLKAEFVAATTWWRR